MKIASKKQDYYQIYLNDDFYIKERIINIGNITTETIKDLQKKLIILVDDNSTAPIKLYINSYGGEIYAALGIYDFIRSLPVEVHTYNFGLCASAATVIFLAGDHRHCTENSRFMFHKPSTSISGGPEEFMSEAGEMTWIYNRMVDIYADRTNKGVAFWKKKMSESNYYFDKAEAKKLEVINVL